jgi:5-methylcytosine-specific restriction endonuclease McrA
LETATFKSFTELQEALNPARLREGRSMRSLRKFLRLTDSESWREVLRRDPCAYCGTPPAGTIDHIDALAVGGGNILSNLTGACASCNCSKADRSVLRYLLQAGEASLA